MKVTGVLSEKGLHAFDAEQRVHAGHVVPRVWVMVVDKEKANLYRKTEHGFDDIAHMQLKPHHHHAGGHDNQEMTIFASEVSDWLEKAQQEHVFDRLIMVAPPRLLAIFRDEFPKNIQAMIMAEVPKDLANMSGKDLHHALEKIVVL